MKTTRLRVEMRDVEPAVVRVIDVPAAVVLPELHDLLQAALGWTDSHLHQYVAADGTCYGMADVDGSEDERDESGVPLRALDGRFTYLYDFGDGWEHDVVVVGPGSDQPGVVDGEGACPPEDVGGPHGYAEFREAVADRAHPEHERMRTWAGSWSDGFDLGAADLLVRQTVGVVPEPVRFVLALAADGVKLTPGGRLPRVFVRQVQERYPEWAWSGRPASVEEDVPPLAALHDVVRQVGLLRLHKGVLGPTRAAADDIEVVRRLRSWFGPDDGFTSVLAGDALAMLVAEGSSRPDEMAGRLLALIDGRWVTSEGQPLDEELTRHALYRLQSVLIGLDLIHEEKGTWAAGPSAQWLLPRATALSHLWTTWHAS